jgi:hypothetical protein
MKILRFSLVAPPGLKFRSLTILYQNIHFNSIRGKKGSYMRVGHTTRLLPLVITKHSTTNGTIYYKGITRIMWKVEHNAATF